MSSGPRVPASPSSAGARVTAATPADRADAAAFAGRVARWDGRSPVRLRQDGSVLRLWAGTPFDVLVTRAVQATVEPADVTVLAGNLLAGLEVGTAEVVDLGQRVDEQWRTQLPPSAGWVRVDTVPAAVLAAIAEEGTTGVRDRPGPAGGAPTALLDAEVLTVTGAGMRVALTMRILFALAGMGFAGSGADEVVRVSATDSWTRVDARFGAVVRRRHALLPLLF